MLGAERRCTVCGVRDGIVAPVTSPPVVWTIVVAGGSARRFGAAKQFEPLGDTTVLGLACRAAATASDGVVVVLPAGATAAELPDLGGVTAAVVAGGRTRAASVRRGLEAVPDEAEVVLVHDGARPLASAALFGRVVQAVAAGADAVVPTAPVVDSLRWRSGGAAPRDDLLRVQTPQGFRADVLRDAHRAGGEATDDASLVEACGRAVVLVEGEEANLKITTPLDLVVAAALVEAAA